MIIDNIETFRVNIMNQKVKNLKKYLEIANHNFISDWAPLNDYLSTPRVKLKEIFANIIISIWLCEANASSIDLFYYSLLVANS